MLAVGHLDGLLGVEAGLGEGLAEGVVLVLEGDDPADALEVEAGGDNTEWFLTPPPPPPAPTPTPGANAPAGPKKICLLPGICL